VNLRVAFGTLGALVLAGLVYALMGEEDDAAARIRKVIDATTAAAEAKELGGIMEGVSEDFVGPYAMKKDELRRFVFAQLHRSEWRRIFVLKPKIELLDEARAHVSVAAVLARGDVSTAAEALAGTKADAFQFEIDFRDEGGDWRVIGIEYRRANPKELVEGVIP